MNEDVKKYTAAMNNFCMPEKQKLSLKKESSSPRLSEIRAEKQREFEEFQKTERLRKNMLAVKWIRQFPVFKKHMLLKQGIHKDLAVHYKAGDYEFGTKHIKFAVNQYVRNKKYQALDLEGDRYDLQGEKVAEIG